MTFTAGQLAESFITTRFNPHRGLTQEIINVIRNGVTHIKSNLPAL